MLVYFDYNYYLSSINIRIVYSSNNLLQACITCSCGILQWQCHAGVCAVESSSNHSLITCVIHNEFSNPNLIHDCSYKYDFRGPAMFNVLFINFSGIQVIMPLCARTKVLSAYMYFAGLIFVVSQSTATTAKIGPLEIFPLHNYHITLEQ